MQQVATNIAPLQGTHQPLPTGPFLTPPGDAPRIKPPASPSAMKRAPSAAILTGESGTNLVLSRLQGWGIPAQASMPGIAYDLIADVKGLDMLRIQVKTRSRPKGQRCSFVMTRGCHYSKAGMFPYDKDDYDIAAFVCLSIGQVFFCPATDPAHRRPRHMAAHAQHRPRNLPARAADDPASPPRRRFVLVRLDPPRPAADASRGASPANLLQFLSRS